MRISYVLVGAALVVSAAAAAPMTSDAAPALVATHTALSYSRDPLSGAAGHAVAYDGSNATITATPGTPGGPAVFDLAADPPASGVTSAYPAELDVTATNSSLALGDNSVTAGSGDGVHVAIDGCDASGTLNVLEMPVDGTNIFTAFAADFTLTCEQAGGYPTVEGSVRWNSTEPYAGVLATPLDWDFGSQPVKYNATPKKLTFRNLGTDSVTFGTASITGSTNAVSISTNTCSHNAVAAAASCAITLVPHPKHAGTSTNVLHLPSADLPAALSIPLRIEGVSVTAGFTAFPNVARGGPGYATFTWQQLPGPMGYNAGHYRVYRGTTKSNMTVFRTVAAGVHKVVDRTVTTGRTYYYAAQPVYPQGVGERGPVVAAIAWPKYTSGMYHKLVRPTRFAGSKSVRAGHPLSLRVLGVHGVPGAGVSAVALNLTAGGSSAATRLRVYPARSRAPGPADLTLPPRISRTNLVLATVGKHGRIQIATAHGSVRVDVDVTGYFSSRSLSHRYGKGAALQDYAYPGTIQDTKKFGVGPLKHGYYINAPVNFSAAATPHVTSLLVEVTAYGSDASGTITGFQTNHRANGTTVLSYSPHQWTSNTTIIPSGLWYGSNTGRYYPSVSFLNRGPKPVQLVVSILGYFDDDTLLLGCRYTPTAPFHLFGATMHGGTTTKFNPGKRHASIWSFTFNTKITAANPSRTTSLSIKAIGGGSPPVHGQVHAQAHQTTTSTTLPPTGVRNEMSIHNAAGTVRVDMWSFGRFDAWPFPRHANTAAALPAAVPPAALPSAELSAAVRMVQ